MIQVWKSLVNAKMMWAKGTKPKTGHRIFYEFHGEFKYQTIQDCEEFWNKIREMMNKRELEFYEKKAKKAEVNMVNDNPLY